MKACHEPPFDHLKDDGFSPDIDLTDVELDDAVAIMEDWFRTFFIDPAHETPYVSSEGGYLYIWGGPYDASDELHSAFEGVASEEVIAQAVENLENDCLEWAPSSFHPNQLEAAYEHAEAHSDWLVKNDPKTIFGAARDQILSTTGALDKDADNSEFVMRMLYIQTYSAVEAYLYDKLRRVLESETAFLENYCKNYPAMAKITYSPSQVLSGSIDIKKVAVEVLGKEVFHRFNNILKIYDHVVGGEFTKTVEIKGAISYLEGGLALRHDCVHRNGHNHQGELQSVSEVRIGQLLSASTIIVDAVEVFVGDAIADGFGF